MLGLPPGVELVGFKAAGSLDKSEFELIDGQLVLGGRPYGSTLAVVKPAKGWEFVFDIRQNGYVAVKQFDAPKTITVTFQADHSGHASAIESVRNIPGFKELKEEPLVEVPKA